MKKIDICNDCKLKKEIHGKGLCNLCYYKMRRRLRRGKEIICKRCKRLRLHGAKGYCMPCYQYIFSKDNRDRSRIKKQFNGLSLKVYNKLTEKCLICGFKKAVDLHHLDNNKQNNSIKNLIGLCPNHHRMIHDFKYRNEIIKMIIKKLPNYKPKPLVLGSAKGDILGVILDRVGTL